MKQIVFLCIVIFISSCEKEEPNKQICKNSIITGERDGECITNGIIEDISVYNEYCQLFPRDSADADINQDGIVDLQIRSDAGCGLGAGSYRTYISLKNGTVISADTIDGNWVFPIDSNKNINSHTVYITDNAFFSINWWTLDYSPDEFYHEENNGYDWTNGQFVGLKVITSNDTLFSWLKVEGNAREIRLTEYAIR